MLPVAEKPDARDTTPVLLLLATTNSSMETSGDLMHHESTTRLSHNHVGIAPCEPTSGIILRDPISLQSANFRNQGEK